MESYKICNILDVSIKIFWYFRNCVNLTTFLVLYVAKKNTENKFIDTENRFSALKKFNNFFVYMSVRFRFGSVVFKNWCPDPDPQPYLFASIFGPFNIGKHWQFGRSGSLLNV